MRISDWSSDVCSSDLALILLYRVVPPPATPLMVIRLVQGQGLERDWVAWEAISPHLRQAVVAAEDNLFCEHSGFDWRSLEEAAKIGRDTSELQSLMRISYAVVCLNKHKQIDCEQ